MLDLRILLFKFETFKVNIVRKGFCRIKRGEKGGGRRVFQHNAHFREFPPLPPLLPPHVRSLHTSLDLQKCAQP